MSHLVREGLLHKVSIGEDDGGDCIWKNSRGEASRRRIGHGAGGRYSRGVTPEGIRVTAEKETAEEGRQEEDTAEV